MDLIDEFCENTVEVSFFFEKDISHVLFLLLKFCERTFDEFLVILEFLFLLVSEHNDFFFVFQDLFALNKLILHFKHFTVEVKILEAGEIVFFEVSLEFFLKGFVFVFHLLNFLFENGDLFLELVVGGLEFFDSDGLDEDVFVLFGGELLEEFVVELIFHDLIFVEKFHWLFVFFE